YRGHSVSDPAKYRSPEELETYKEQDPIDQLKQYLLDHKIFNPKDLEDIDQVILKEMDEAEAFADQSEFPPASELYTDNYVQPDYPFIKD
ncbi:MAG TPA: thiamine pyrophosphate-dependent enzyme, partial [Saprospiraceae bacterium]|nr:thiamine pyrophosphate-dependent enzyme [Saprospiraceae bacterium]